MSDTPTPDPQPDDGGDQGDQDQPQTFTQADVDRIVRERVKRERDKFADYDQLKERAGQSTTLEERVAGLEAAVKTAEQRALRAEVANAKGLTPTQAKRLVGETREELEADADELLADIGAAKKNGNHVPREGTSPPPASGDEMRDFARNLFARATSE
jgi:hypothetical protein